MNSKLVKLVKNLTFNENLNFTSQIHRQSWPVAWLRENQIAGLTKMSDRNNLEFATKSVFIGANSAFSENFSAIRAGKVQGLAKLSDISLDFAKIFVGKQIQSLICIEISEKLGLKQMSSASKCFTSLHCPLVIIVQSKLKLNPPLDASKSTKKFSSIKFAKLKLWKFSCRKRRHDRKQRFRLHRNRSSRIK